MDLQARPVGEPKFTLALGGSAISGTWKHDSTARTSSRSWETAQEKSVARDSLGDNPACGGHLRPRHGLGEQDGRPAAWKPQSSGDHRGSQRRHSAAAAAAGL